MYTYPVPAWYRNDWASNDSYLKLSKEKVAQSIEIAQGVIIDYDAIGRVVGIELLGNVLVEEPDIALE